MKVLVIPDIHLKPYIFYKAAELMRKGCADRAVCLMDIPDDWKKELCMECYEQTYDSVIDFAKEFPETLWCYGNHDLSYVWEEPETGYSSIMRNLVCRKLHQLDEALGENNSIRYVNRIDNVLFCHGGVSRYFVEKYVEASKYDDTDYVLSVINGLGNAQMWCDDSPIWYRPQYYSGRMYMPRKYLQVVGHTPVEKIFRYRNVLSCDSFSTNPDGTPIGTQEFVVVDTVTKEFITIS